MPPRKHQRAASDPSSNAGPSVKASKIVKVEKSDALPRATFQDLPFELRKTILDLACSRSPSKDDKDDKDANANAAPRIRLDSNTLFNLILVSREFYATLKPNLWRHVKLVRPSQLAEFRDALVRHPANSELVQSLHIGPLSDLPPGWWPVRPKRADQEWLGDDGSWMLFRTGLTKCDEALRPLWCRPDKEWATCIPARTCEGGAATEAIRVALLVVDISLGDPVHNPGWLSDWRGESLDINQWTMRLFEAQGVLDLYLVGMRRIEEAENRPIQSWRASKAHPIGTDERDCRHGECGHYPSLILKGFEGRGPQVKEQQPEGDTIIVRREEVMKHLTRRGAHTDSFEHPIIFSQSDLRLLAQDDDGIITIDYEQQRVSSFYPESDYDDDNGDLDNMLFRFNDDDFSQYDHRPVRPASPTESDMSADDTFDLLQHDGISALANSVLRRTPKVLNLSLTGFLSHCIQQPKPSLLRTLRCLSLGPPAQPPGAVFLFQELWLPAMEKLRFSGSYLGWSIARRIAGNDSGNWRAMREAQWDFGSSKIPGAGGNNVTWLLSLFRQLQGHKDGGTPEESGEDQQDDGALDDALTGDEVALLSKAKADTKTRYTEARIHPTLLSRVLERAPSPQVRRAWLHGLPVNDAPHRVRLVKSRAANEKERDHRWCPWPRPLQDYDIHRAESEQWWEECAWELEHEGKSTAE